MSRFRSSALDIFRVSRRNLLREEKTTAPSERLWERKRQPRPHGPGQKPPSWRTEGLGTQGEKITQRASPGHLPSPVLTWPHCSVPGRRRRAHARRKPPLGGSVSWGGRGASHLSGVLGNAGLQKGNGRGGHGDGGGVRCRSNRAARGPTWALASPWRAEKA